MSDHDQTNSFTAQRAFDDVHAVVAKDANQCWSHVSGGMLMPTGSGYVHAGGGIKREVEDKVVEPGKRAAVNVVVRAYWPLPPESYILRAEIESLDPTSTRVTTYNANAVKGQRVFHRQVQRWVLDDVADCSGMGPFD